MLWHRQAIFQSNGDKLSSSAERRIRTHGLRHQIASRLNVRWQTDWAFEDQAKNLNTTAHPYDQRAFSPHDPTASWLSTLEIYMFVIVNFDALAQAIDFRIERRHVVFLYWMQDSNPGSLEPNVQLTECPFEDQAKNFTSMARPLDQRAFSPLDPIAGCLSHLALQMYNGCLFSPSLYLSVCLYTHPSIHHSLSIYFYLLLFQLMWMFREENIWTKMKTLSHHINQQQRLINKISVLGSNQCNGNEDRYIPLCHR